MCTPSVSIDTILTSGDTHFWLLKRKDVDKNATIGGFVGDRGEPTEEAAVRELKEELNIDLLKGSSDPVLFGVCGGLVRDARRNDAISAIYASHHHRED